MKTYVARLFYYGGLLSQNPISTSELCVLNDCRDTAIRRGNECLAHKDKGPVVISGPSPIGTATAFVFANAGPKVVVASRRESEREIVVHGAENRMLVKVYLIKTRAACKADMKALVDKTLVKVGDSAPDFILPDTDGNAVRCTSLLRAGHVVVVFCHGNWCPYCDLHLRGFQRRLAELRQLGAQVVAISPELADDLLSAQIKRQLAFTDVE